MQDERDFIEYLIASLGKFSVPTGTPLLCELALNETGTDPASVALHRQLAVSALANLGENVKRYDHLPAERKAAIEASLEGRSRVALGQTADQWAKQALAYLQAPTREAEASGVAQTLARSPERTIPFAEIRPLALTFWEGTAEENASMDQTLVDVVEGRRPRRGPRSRSKDDGKALVVDSAVRGREIRYQAVQALARAAVPWPPTASASAR